MSDAGDDYVYSEALAAFEGSYNFSVGIEEGTAYVTFQENAHVEDEVGSIACDLPDPNSGVTAFCEEPLEVDASLGTDEDPKMVHAFDFGCRVD